MISPGIIGNGRMAKAITDKMLESGIAPRFIAARNWSKSNWDALPMSIPKYIIGEVALPPCEVLFFCVNDKAISVLSRFISGTMLNIHFAGSMPLSALEAPVGRGVIWPIQSINDHIDLNWDKIPVIWDADTDFAKSYASEFANFLNENKSMQMDFQMREKLHLSAVFTSNFINALFMASEDILGNTEMVKYLLPLIEHSVERYQGANAVKWQTGPAARNDEQVIQKQLQLLKDNPELAEIYKSMTHYIRQKMGFGD